MPENEGDKNEITEYYESVKKIEIEGYESGIKKARTALFVTAALFFVMEILTAAISDIPMTPLFWGIVLIECGAFVALGFWTRSKPYAAIIVGLVLFVFLWALAIAGSGLRGAFGGIIVRVIIIIYLVKALGPAKAWEEAKKHNV